MAPSLPGDLATDLIDEVEQLRRLRGELTAPVEGLAEQVQRLRARFGGVED